VIFQSVEDIPVEKRRLANLYDPNFCSFSFSKRNYEDHMKRIAWNIFFARPLSFPRNYHLKIRENIAPTLCFICHTSCQNRTLGTSSSSCSAVLSLFLPLCLFLFLSLPAFPTNLKHERIVELRIITHVRLQGKY